MRLDKYICQSTELTRTEAKKLLKSGEVIVDGEVAKNPAMQVIRTTEVSILGQQLRLRSARYIMLHKPVNMICSNVDELYPSVLHCLDVDKAFDLHIAGRLDADTTGLVLITDDGAWSHKLTSPRKDCPKRYRVTLAKDISEDAVVKLEQGILLQGEKQITKPAIVEVIEAREILLTIVEGRYHQVKRMLAAVGNKVRALHREQIGAISLDDQLDLGEWRYLTADEIASVT